MFAHEGTRQRLTAWFGEAIDKGLHRFAEKKSLYKAVVVTLYRNRIYLRHLTNLSHEERE